MDLEVDDRPLQGEFFRTPRRFKTHGRSPQTLRFRVSASPRGLTEGKLGGQAKVKGRGRHWKD